MSKPTTRTKNTCRQCGSSWTPRGTSVSNMCPECGSQEVVVTAQLVRPKRRGWRTAFLAVAAVIVLGGGVAAAVVYLTRDPEPSPATDSETKDRPQAEEGPFKPGDEVRIKARTRTVVLADEDMAEQVAQFRAANNQAGILQLMRLHKTKLVEIPNGTRAAVLGTTPHGVRVRIAEGGWRDREGILPADMLEPVE
jgi:predicted RNA-binding Zn-ribbon protein involved in translation (DUF1610 family)